MRRDVIMNKAKLFRCRICGDPYVGVNPPNRCPFCGAYEEFIIEAKNYDRSFDVALNDKDKANAEKAFRIEISNAEFYFCAAVKSDDEEGRQLFKALGKVEAEHAAIWRKILKAPKESIGPSEKCSLRNLENLEESHSREARAIDFYKKAADEATNERVKEIFGALVQVETDHLYLSEERMKK